MLNSVILVGKLKHWFKSKEKNYFVIATENLGEEAAELTIHIPDKIFANLMNYLEINRMIAIKGKLRLEHKEKKGKNIK